MKKIRLCQNCGCDISDRPSNHYLCYSCWLKLHGKKSNYNKSSYYYDDDDNDDFDDYDGYDHNDDTDTYYDRYQGDSDYDLGPDWDYDEFPPENL